MRTMIYAIFRNADVADCAFMELLENGASVLDFVIVTRSTYQNPKTETENWFLQTKLEPEDYGSTFPYLPSIDEPGSELVKNPFSDTPEGTRLLDNLRNRGDLAANLRELGFDDDSSIEIEDAVLEGAAILMLRVPTAGLGEDQCRELIRKCGGTLSLTRLQHGYLG